MCLVTLSSRIVSVKAGHGEEWAYLDLLLNKGCAHWEQAYIPMTEESNTKAIHSKVK